MDDFKPHLLISTSDVEHVSFKPRGETKDRGLDRRVHGSKLSSGLQNIVDAYTRIQSGDSLSDEDIRLFEVVLPEGTKFSDKWLREFLNKEGVTITSVKDSHHAVVASPKTGLDKLMGRVGNYRDKKKVDGKYQFIDGFLPLEAEDKQSESLRKLTDKLGAERLDISIKEQLIESHLGKERYAAAEQKLLQRIQDLEGEVIGQPYELTDETHIVRAKIPLDQVTAVASDSMVLRMTPTDFYGTAPSATMEPSIEMALNPNVVIDDLPIVAVLDTGIDFPPAFESLVVEHWVPTGAEAGDKRHGTSVASKIVFSNVGEQLTNGEMIPRARVIDCNIRGRDYTSDDPCLISNEVMIKRIQEAVLRYKDITKIFNLSSASKHPIQGDEMSLLGYELDALSQTYGVKFILPTGNHELYKIETSLEAMLDDDDTHIAAPADSMLNIAVGAIVASSHQDSLSKQFDVAPYSRIGPGFCGSRKPDIVTFAGNKTQKGGTVPDAYSIMLGAGGKWEVAAGTSYAAPVVAGDLAEICMTVPDNDILLSECLLYHACEMPLLLKDRKKLSKEDNSTYGNWYGRGISTPLVSMYSSPDRVTYLHRGTINRLDKQRIKFLVPSVCDSLDMSKRSPKLKVTVTSVCQTPIDNAKGTDYIGSYVTASFHFINSNGIPDTKNPTKSDCRKEWDICYHFEQTLSSFTSGDWSIWLQLYTRYEVEDKQQIDFALAVTVEDMTKSLNLYNSVLLQAKDRFKAVDMIRLPIRY